MCNKSIIPSLLLVASWGLAQSAATLPKKEPVEPETAAPVAQAGPIKESKPPVRTPDPALGAVVGTGLDQHVAPATALTNNELLVRGKTIYVVTDSFFVKKEQLEQGLVNRKELGQWGIHVVDSEKQADLILTVRRAPFQNNFPFTFKDRVSGIVVMGATVNSLFGTVPGKIADRLADRLKEIFAEEQKKQKK